VTVRKTLPLVVLMLGFVACIFGAQPAAAAPPASAKELAVQLMADINAHDKKAVDALVYWGRADGWSRSMTEALLSLYEAETITSARITPLVDSSNQNFTMNGKTYGPSIPLQNTLEMEYAKGPGVVSNHGSLGVGSKDGIWYIVAIAPK
jgi:hypothetical protein